MTWQPISADLTSGCEGAAPNGARGCFISAIGVADGGDGVYVGTDEGWIQVSPDAVTSDQPSWQRVGVGKLPNRPVNQIAVDRSNWRIAYAAYGGFGAATPGNSGHLFATSDGGEHWKNITANLPDVPVNTRRPRPGRRRHAVRRHRRRRVHELQRRPATGSRSARDAQGRRVAARLRRLPRRARGRHARSRRLHAHEHGARSRHSWSRRSTPACRSGRAARSTTRSRCATSATPTRPAVTVTDPLPKQHEASSVGGQGGHARGNDRHWDGLTVPAGGSITLHFTS